jgi:hypothetical protein
VEEFALNQDLCMSDKRALDNLTKAAFACGKKEELKLIFADDAKFAELMSRYHAECTGPDGKKKKNSPTAKGLFMDFMEQFESRQEVIMDDKGEMMDEEMYADFAATPAGGRKTRKAALLAWEEMKANKKDYVHDMKGPGGSLRLRIHTGDTVTFRSAASVSKKLQLKRKTIKDPSEANVKGHFKDLMTSFDSMKESAGMDLGDLAKSMAQSGQGSEDGAVSSCFDGAKVADMSKMLQFSDSEEESDGEESSEAEPAAGKKPKKPRKSLEADGEDDGDGEVTTKGKKSEPGSAKKGSDAWFDLENETIKAKRMWRNSIGSLRTSIESKAEEANKVMMDAGDFKDDESVKEVYLSCQRRVVWAKAMVHTETGKIEALLKVAVFLGFCRSSFVHVRRIL